MKPLPSVKPACPDCKVVRVRGNVRVIHQGGRPCKRKRTPMSETPESARHDFVPNDDFLSTHRRGRPTCETCGMTERGGNHG